MQKKQSSVEEEEESKLSAKQQKFEKTKNWIEDAGLVQKVRKYIQKTGAGKWKNLIISDGDIDLINKHLVNDAKELGYINVKTMLEDPKIKKSQLQAIWEDTGIYEKSAKQEKNKSEKGDVDGDDFQNSESDYSNKAAKSTKSVKSEQSSKSNKQIQEQTIDTSRKVSQSIKPINLLKRGPNEPDIMILNKYFSKHLDQINSVLKMNYNEKKLQKFKQEDVIKSVDQYQKIIGVLQSQNNRNSLDIIGRILEAGDSKVMYADIKTPSDKVNKKVTEITDKLVQLRGDSNSLGILSPSQEQSSLVKKAVKKPILFTRNQQQKVWNDMLNNPNYFNQTEEERQKISEERAKKNQPQDLSVITDRIGIESYMVKYPTVQEMLNMTTTRHIASDIAQKKHLTMTQNNLVQNILSSEQTFMPNVQFLKEKYDYTRSPEDLQVYKDAVIKQMGVTQVARNGQQDWSKQKYPAATKNLGAPAMGPGLEKPEMIDIKDLVQGIYAVTDYVSKLSGNLNKTDLKSYQTKQNVFSNTIVQKEEPTYFKPTVNQSFQLRELMC